LIKQRKDVDLAETMTLLKQAVEGCLSEKSAKRFGDTIAEILRNR